MSIHTLRLATNQRINFGALRECNGVRVSQINTGNYLNGACYTLPNGEAVRICYDPLPKRYAAGTTVIETEVSDFGCWQAYIEMLTSVIQDFDIAEPTILRIDLYVDVSYAVDFFYRRLFIKGVRKFDYVESSTKSLVVGRSPRRNSIYEKDGPRLTRVEVQYRAGMRPIKRLTEVEDLLEFEPFKKFELYKVAKGKDRFETRGILEGIKNLGLLRAVREEMHLNRFRRYIERGFLIRLKKPDLGAQYREGVKRLIKPE